MTTISSLPRVSSLSDQTLFLVTENGVTKVVTWAFIRTTSVGFLGSTGYVGSRGPLGFTGSRGAGFSGSQGPIGPRGPAGGFTGSQGFAYAGSQGAGFTGSRGISGFAGSIGVAGGVIYPVISSGSSNYIIAGANNPTLILVKGFTYYFTVNATGHPFWIKTSQTTGAGDVYSSGVTNNGTESGIVTFTVPWDAPSTLYYICQFHGSMTGQLTIVDSASGYTGSRGFGFAGSAGPQGPAGGFTGSIGNIGFIGSPGLPGSPGGYTGSQGDTGSSGFSGSQGSGFTGSGGQGFTGSRGFSGSQGPKGESSFVYGSSAPLSPLVGDRWLDSETGRELVFVNDGNSTQWVEVAGGRVGFIGSKGEPGLPGGYTGSRGATGFGGLGFTGSSGGGFTGSSGAFAAMGFTGSGGLSGSLGFSGSRGAGFTGSGGQGFTGSQGSGFVGSGGTAGIRGFSGSQGSGFVGSQGGQGLLGFSGSQGSGFIGSQGIRGELGFVGSRGTLGFQGSRGVDGYYGSIGTRGFTGSAGTSGSSGAVGFVGSQGSAGFNWSYNVKNYGAKGNGSSVVADMTAETAAIQAAINAAQTNGGTVFFPAGVYRINGPLSITTVGQDPAARPHLLGEGPGASFIIQSSTNNGISVTGDVTVPGTYVTIQGLTLVGNLSGSGLSFTDSAFAKVSDVHITNWATGVYGIDSLSMTFERCIIRFNTNGFRFERSTSGTFRSNPNAITMIGCIVGNNTAYGGWIIGAGTFNYIGGSIESNASNTLENASNWGLRITDPGGDNVAESSVGFALHGVYFEANGGRANFWVEATEANTGVVGTINGCSFNRTSTSYSTNNIRCEASSSSFGFPIAVVGCGFRGLDGYIATISRPNILNLSNHFAINPVSCRYSATVDAYTIPIPLSTNSIGTPGMITSDNSYVYICAADNRWYRYSIATF